MKKILLFIFIICIKQVNAQTPSWAWAKGWGNNLGQAWKQNESSFGNSIAADINGNVYTVGYFDTPIMIVGNYTLTNSNNSGNSGDVFIIKYDATGNVLWATSAQGDSSDSGLGIVIDNANNICITGAFSSSTITFGTKTLTNSNNGTSDIFIAKYDILGNIIWAKNYGGSNDEFGNAIIKDANNDLYISGNFKSQSFSIGTNSITIDSSGNQNMFIAKFDSSGNPIYAKSVGKACNIAIQGNNIASDNNNNIYVSGSFSKSEIILGNDTLHCNSNSSNYFLVKYDAIGNLLWVKSGSGLNYSVAANALTVDAANNIYISGNFAGNSLKIGNTTLTSFSEYSGFIAKYSSFGSVIWAKNLQDLNPQPWPASCIAVDASGGVYVGGGFTNEVGYTPFAVFGNDTLYSGNPGQDAIFIVKYDSSGNSIWGQTASSIRWNVMLGVAVDKYNNIYTVGYYNSPVIIFDNDTLFNSNATNWQGFNYFVAKIGTAGVGIEKYNINDNVIVYPNPSKNNFTIETNTTDKQNLNLYDINGKLVLSQIIQGTTNINTSTLAQGIYNLSIINKEGVVNKHLIIVH